MLVLHLVVDGIYRFQTCLGLVLYSKFVELGLDWQGKVGIHSAAMGAGRLYFLLYILVYIGMFVLETKVLELGFDSEQAQTMCQRCIYVEGFAGNLVPLIRGHGSEGAHVVQTVGHLYQHHTDVLAHGEEQLTEVLGLHRCAVAENATGNLGKPFDKLCYFRPEILLYVLDCVLGILDHIVQQCCTYRSGTEAYFLKHNLGHGNGVHDVWLAAAAADTFMGLFGETVGTFYYLHLLAVIAAQITVHEIAEGRFDHAVVFLGTVCHFSFHRTSQLTTKIRKSADTRNFLTIMWILSSPPASGKE